MQPGLAFLHYSFAAQLDANRPVTLEGTVTKMEWQSGETVARA